MHLILFFPSDQHFLIPSLSWCTAEKRCVSVCVSPAWLCRKTVWMRSQHAADRQHLHCKGLSWLPLIAHPCCFHAERGSDWGVVASAGPADVQITEGGWDGLRNRLWWSNQNDKFDSLDEGPQFVEQIAERWRDWTPCGLILKRTEPRTSFVLSIMIAKPSDRLVGGRSQTGALTHASVCSFIWTVAAVIT